jgi:two-component system sensor histidine kinase KdpD
LPPTAKPVRPARRSRIWGVAVGYASAVAQSVLTTAATALVFDPADHSDIVLMYILGIMVVAARCGRGPATLSAVLSVAAFDLFYTPPYGTFAVSDVRSILTFAVLLIVGLVISSLTAQIRRQAAEARMRESRTAALYRLSRDLTQLRDASQVAACAAHHIGETLDGRVVILLRDATGELAPAPGTDASILGEPAALAAARRAQGHTLADHHVEVAGPTLFLPLTAADRTVGVLGFHEHSGAGLQDPDDRKLLATFCGQAALALERELLSVEAQALTVRARTEELRSALLSSVSHDLRTPLAAVTGAASTLLFQGDALSEAARRDLLTAIHEEASHLGRLVGDLLDMTRLESGSVELRKDWTPIEEPIGAALGRLEAALGAREVRVDVAPGLPLVLLDVVLVQQVLINLLENAIKHGGPGPIEVRAALAGEAVCVEIRDHGPGIAVGSELLIFEKFFRASQRGTPGGVGLGLAICRAITQAHGATLTAGNAVAGGAVFRVTFPWEGAPPSLIAEADEAPADSATVRV